MHPECRERFLRHRLQSKPLVSQPGMHHDTHVTDVPWCMPGSLAHCGGKTFPTFPAHAQPTNVTCLAKGPCSSLPVESHHLFCYQLPRFKRWTFRQWKSVTVQISLGCSPRAVQYTWSNSPSRCSVFYSFPDKLQTHMVMMVTRRHLLPGMI